MKRLKHSVQMVISGIGTRRVNLILDMPAPKNFTSWDSIKQRIQEYAKSKGDDATKAATEEKNMYNVLSNKVASVSTFFANLL